mgnify:CR=1 FL=1
MSTLTLPAYRIRYLVFQAFSAALIGVFLFLLSAFAILVGFEIWYAGRIYPGVLVGGVPVGGLTPQEAASKISQSYDYPHSGKIVLQYQEKMWSATPNQLGLFLDPENSARAAFQLGRAGSLKNRLEEQLYTWYAGHDLPPILIFDQRTAYIYLSGIAPQINKPVIEASLSLKGSEVIMRPGEIGRTLDIPANLLILSTQFNFPQDMILPLVVYETPPAILNVQEQAEQARRILSQPLTLSLPDQDQEKAGPWIFDQNKLASMLTIERVQVSGGARYQVALDSTQLRSFLTQLAPSLKRSPANARFIFNDKSRQLEVLQPSVTGRSLDVEASLRSIQERLVRGEHNIPLVLNYLQPAVPDTKTAEELGIRELIRAETSYFYGSNSPRVQNIKTAASRFHGLLVAPGETFSMATALGNISLDNGYAEALIILGNQTIKGVGGGVCQVSTTLFRAAFFAGFPIIERHAHAYRVYYYEKVAGNKINPRLAGLDATVFVPLVDLKFKNDTPNWLLMETYVTPASSSITWKFYSTSDGRKVEWDTTGPTNIVAPPDPVYRENPDLKKGEIKQVDWAAEGADVTVTRTVTRAGTVIIKDRIATHYKAWGDVFEYGPGTEIP